MSDVQQVDRLPFKKVFIKALFSKSLYRSIAQNSQYLGFRYLAILCVVLMVPITIRMVIDFDHYKYSFIKPVIKQFPQTMHLKNGELTVQPNKRYWIQTSAPNQHNVIVIDTEHDVSEYGYPGLPAPLFIGKHGALYYYNGAIHHVPYDKNLDLKVTPDNFWHRLKRFTFWLNIIEFVVFYLVGLLLLYGAYWVYSFLLTSFTSVAATFMDLELPLITNWQLTIVGSTLPSCLLAVLYLFEWLNIVTLAAILIIQFVYLFSVAVIVRPILRQQSK